MRRPGCCLLSSVHVVKEMTRDATVEPGGQMPRERFVPATSRALKGHQPNARHASGLLYVGKPWSKARSSIDPFFLSLRTYGLGFSCRAA
jgi:hypothetical protein